MLLYLATEGSTEGPNPVVPAVGEIIIGSIAFAILCYVLMKYVWPRMEATFEARRDAIEGGIKRAEEAQDEAKRLLTEYRQQLAEARSEAAQIRDNARAEGQRIIEEMRTTAQQESARIVARGDEQLSVQRQQVVRELRGEIGTLATQLAERVVGESLGEDQARQRTVDRFLDDLDGMAESVPAGVGAPAAAEAGGPATPSGGPSSGGPSSGGPSSGGPSSGGPSSGGPSSGGSGPAGGSAPSAPTGGPGSSAAAPDAGSTGGSGSTGAAPSGGSTGSGATGGGASRGDGAGGADGESDGPAPRRRR